MNKKIKITKVNLDLLLVALRDIYQKGIDFIDMSFGEEGSLEIYFKKEYIHPDFLNFYSNILQSENPPLKVDFTSEDFNELS